MYMYMYMCSCIHIYIYVCIEKERERERDFTGRPEGVGRCNVRNEDLDFDKLVFP